MSGTADTRPTPAVPLRALATGLVLLAWRPELVLDLLLILPRTTLEAAIGTLIDQLDRLDDADAEPEPQEA